MKTFLSIGSGSGMGLATAERFAKEGFQVVLSASECGQDEGACRSAQGKGL